MASVAESSEGSLPLAKIAQFQAQFLQERVLPEAHGADVGRDDEATESTGDDKNKDERSNGRGDVVIAEAARAYRTPVSSPKTDALKVPRLQSAKSAPPAEMEAMVNPSPSQEVFQEMTRANSFHGFEGGDTQPLESQVYHDHYESVALSKSGNAITPKKEKVLLHISPRARITHDTEATGQTPRTLQEGDTGFVDLQNGWDEILPSPTAGFGSELGDSVNGESAEKQLPGQDGVFRRPNLPQTPSLAGHKRRRSGDVLTSEPSAKKTPGYSQAFEFKGQKGGLMTGSQLFEQTQARSSPMPDALRSDPALTRPSPNIQNQFPASSPTVMLSSPIDNRAPPATAGEPRERYITFKESQERKRTRLEQDFGLEPRSNNRFNDNEDDDENTQERRIAQKELRRTLSDQALHELRSVSAHSKPRSRPATSSSPRKPTIVDLRTPATARKGGDLEYDFPDEGESDDGEEQDQSIAEDEHVDDAADDDQQDVNDMYDELGQTVLRSQGPEPDEGEGEEDRGEDLMNDDKMADEEIEEAGRVIPEVTLVQGSSQQDRSNFQRRSQTATQHSAIVDSQPLRNERQRTPAFKGNNGSPSCSYVPGSQYAGRTSQDQASVPVRRSNGSMGPPTLSASKSEDALQQVVPSSPPLAATDGSTVDYITEASIERRRTLEQFQLEQREVEPEIPESDMRGTEHDSSRSTKSEDRLNTESNNAPFSTARSHLSAIGPSRSQDPRYSSPLKAFGSQQSTVNSQSPRTKAGVRRFADIAGAAAAPTGSGEEALADVDAVMSGFISAEDQQVLDATSSPPRERPRKRRSAVGKRSVPSSSPANKPHVDAEVIATAELTHFNMQDPSASNEGGQLSDADELETRALRNSLSKANQQRTASPPPESTPESVKQREQAGAKAASQLLAKRASRVTKPAKLSSTARKAGSKLQFQTAAQDNDATPKPGSRSKRTSDVKNTQPPVEELAGQTVSLADMEEQEIEETVIETREGDPNAEQDHRLEQSAIAAPHRIFALFKGTFNLFYPATWLGASNNGGHRVKFDDETVTSIDINLVARMELALGDQVKVDYPGMKNKVWIVKGFGPALPPHKAQDVLTDLYGHETVKVQAKTIRNSVPGRNAVAQGEGEVVNVAVEVVYLTHAMWTHFSRREFQPGVQHAVKSKLGTPSTGVHTPVNAKTPPSRSRRVTTSTTAKAIEKRGSFLRDESAAAVRTPAVGVFHGMAFAVSYGQNESEKVNVTRLIQRNGGTILEDGFEGLFDAPNLDELETTSPCKNPGVSGGLEGACEQASLQLKAEHEGLGFVALIADKHSRRAKYIQALALGLPTLSGRWIMDSLDASKNDSLSGAQAAPLSWTKYVLAAGESSYLNGAVRSRDLAAYEAASAKLDHTVANRPLLLKGEGVLIVAAKKSKAVWERRKAFAFLTLALGAGHAKRVSDLQEAKKFLANEAEKLKFVYVDGSVADASAAVFGNGGGGGGGKHSKKRKRDHSPATAAKVVDAKAMSATDGKVRIVNDEFVVQSLILGALVD